MDRPRAYPFDPWVVRGHDTGDPQVGMCFLEGLGHAEQGASGADRRHPAIDPSVHLIEDLSPGTFPVGPRVVDVAQLLWG